MKIEKNIPIAAASRSGAKPFKYPFPDMEVGDSFFIEGFTRQKQWTVTACGIAYTKRGGKGKKFTTRKEPQGIRVWRIQ